MSAIALRPETSDDAAAIRALTAAAFARVEHSDGSEPEIVEALRRHGDLALSLVAEDEERVIGHIAFSPVSVSDGASGWYGLGPVSVWPARQGEGIGSRLVSRGIGDLRAQGARGVVVLGDPAFYARFGFEHDPALRYPGPPADYFQRLVLQGEPPAGDVSYPPAFS